VGVVEVVLDMLCRICLGQYGSMLDWAVGICIKFCCDLI